MTEEIKNENVISQTNEKKCCISYEFKLFLLVILASFIGCILAMFLYSAKPQCQIINNPPPPQFHRFEHRKFDKHRDFNFVEQKDFKGKEHFKKDFEQKMNQNFDD